MYWSLRELYEHINSNKANINGKWVPARPENYKLISFRERLRNSWLVFVGKADIVVWPEGQ